MQNVLSSVVLTPSLAILETHSLRKIFVASNVLAPSSVLSFSACELISTVFFAFPKHGVVLQEVEPVGQALLFPYISARADARLSEVNWVVKPNPIDVPSGHFTY